MEEVDRILSIFNQPAILPVFQDLEPRRFQSLRDFAVIWRRIPKPTPVWVLYPFRRPLRAAQITSTAPLAMTLGRLHYLDTMGVQWAALFECPQCAQQLLTDKYFGLARERLDKPNITGTRVLHITKDLCVMGADGVLLAANNRFQFLEPLKGYDNG